MTTNNKRTNEAIKAYILECTEDEQTTEEAKIKEVASRFLKEYCYIENLRRYGTYQDTFIEWLKGLPSALSLDYTYFDILQVMEQRFFLPLPEGKDEFDAAELFYKLIAREFFKLCRKYDINIYI